MSLVRPEAPGTLNEMSDEEDEPEYQDRAYRNAWEPFDPDKEYQRRMRKFRGRDNIRRELRMDGTRKASQEEG